MIISTRVFSLKVFTIWETRWEFGPITIWLKVSIISGNFIYGETLVGTATSATFVDDEYDSEDIYDKYTQNDELEQEADLLLDFTESNPFGNYWC